MTCFESVKDIAAPRVAIVHDYLVQMGGAERVVESLHRALPSAPIFTSAYVPDVMPIGFRTMDIRTSFMQRLPAMERRFRTYLPLYPFAFESLNLSDFDIVLASSSAWAHGVRVHRGQQLICGIRTGISLRNDCRATTGICLGRCWPC